MLGLRRSLLLVGYLFTTVHVLVLLSRFARPEARPELASYPGSIEASPEPEDHVPSDLHSIPISLHYLANTTITINCTSISYGSISWKKIDRSSFLFLNWAEKASFATFRMVSIKLGFIYTPNISSCLGSRCKTSSDNDETLLIIVMNITMDFVIEHSCTVRQQPQASSDKNQMDYTSQSWLITTPHPVCTVYYLFDHAAVTTATFGTFTTVATFATIVSLMPHKHKKTVLTNNNSLCCDHCLETLTQHTDRISETLAQHTDRISETLAQHTDRISETVAQHTDRNSETVAQHTDNRHIDKKELNKETVKTCDAATMTEDSGDTDKPSPRVDNLSNSSGTPAPLSDVPTHKELLIELEEVTEWEKLGLLLELPYYELKKIEKQNKEVEINKMELFDLFLRYAKRPSWEAIVCAVRKFNPNLAEKIALRTSHFSKGKSATDNSDIEQQLAGESLNQTYHFSSASSPRFQQSRTFLPPKSVSRPPFLLPTPRVSIVLVIIM